MSLRGAKPPQDSQGGLEERSLPNMPELLGCPAGNYQVNHISKNLPFNRLTDNHAFNRLTG